MPMSNAERQAKYREKHLAETRQEALYRYHRNQLKKKGIDPADIPDDPIKNDERVAEKLAEKKQEA